MSLNSTQRKSSRQGPELVEGLPLQDTFRTLDWREIKEKLKDLEPILVNPYP